MIISIQTLLKELCITKFFVSLMKMKTSANCPYDKFLIFRDESFNFSNVSRTLSEQMHELVRAFSSRTQRVKEKTTLPPTPTSSSSSSSSSLSSLEVQSGESL